jgi:hypothetical protein
LHRNAPNASACADLQAAFLAAARTNTLTLALISERALYAPYYRMNLADAEALSRDKSEEDAALLPPTRQPSGGWSPLRASGFFERDLAFFFSTMDEAIALSRLPAPAMLQLSNTFNISEITKRRFYIMSGMLLPSMSKSAVAAARGEASAKLPAIALAIEAFRATHNRLPENLDELIPEFLPSVPTDPFDGKPMSYRTLPSGYIIYSIDSDGVDQGGKEAPPSRRSRMIQGVDMTFRVER